MKFTPFPYALKFASGLYLDMDILNHTYIKTSSLPLLRFRHIFEATVFISSNHFSNVKVVII